jgi:hypothetical protein
MKHFATIEKLDNAILYTLELIASVSVLFLAVGLIASVANVLTEGSILTNNEFGRQFYAWSQAIGIDASIPGVMLRLVVYAKEKRWFNCVVYTILSLLVLFTAYNISNIESITQTFNTTLSAGYAHSLVSVEVLVNIRSLTVILIIVSHSLRHVQADTTPAVKVVRPKSVQPVKAEAPTVEATIVQEEHTPKEPTPIHKNFDRVKAYLADHPNASARGVGRALGMSATSAAKWVKKVRAA